MCEPTTIIAGIGMVAAAAGTAVSVKQQNDLADNQMEAADNAAQADYNATAERQSQIRSQADDQKLERKRAVMRERAQIRTASAESGLNGIESRFLEATQLNQDLALGAIDENTVNNIVQTQRDNDKTFAVQTGRINEAKSKKLGGASAGLQVATSGLTGYTTGYSAGKTLSS